MSNDSSAVMSDAERLDWLEAQAEAAYDKMYDCRHSHNAAALYSDAKEALYEAVGLARHIGREATAQRLEARLAHIRAVFRSQFT